MTTGHVDVEPFLPWSGYTRHSRELGCHLGPRREGLSEYEDLGVPCPGELGPAPVWKRGWGRRSEGTAG